MTATDRPRLRGLALGADATALAALGLRVEGDAAHVGGVALGATGRGGGILGWDVVGLRATGLLPVAPAAGAGVDAGEHPLGATAVDHVVVRAGDVVATVAGLGLEARGVTTRDGRTYAFVPLGTALLEVVGPAEPDPTPAVFWGLALTVADLDAAVAHLGPACGRPRDALQPGRRIATVRHEALGLGVPTALLTPRLARD